MLCSADLRNCLIYVRSFTYVFLERASSACRSTRFVDSIKVSTGGLSDLRPARPQRRKRTEYRLGQDDWVAGHLAFASARRVPGEASSCVLALGGSGAVRNGRGDREKRGRRWSQGR